MTLVYCDQTVGWIKMKLGVEVGLSPGHIVLDRDSAPLPKGAQSPIFGRCPLWPNGWMDRGGTWYGGRPRTRPHFARLGPSFPCPKRGHSPQFSTHVYCGQKGEWIKMSLGSEVHVGPGDIVLDRDGVPPKKGHSTPSFRPYCGQTVAHLSYC